MSLPNSISFNDLGGTKTDYSAVVDTSTDRSADEVNLAFLNTAEMTRTSIRAWLKFSVSATEVITVTSWDSNWKGATITPPIITLVSTGKFLVTLPATIIDEAGTTSYLNLHAVFASIASTTDAITAISYGLEPQVLTANTVRLHTKSATSLFTPINTVISLLLI